MDGVTPAIMGCGGENVTSHKKELDELFKYIQIIHKNVDNLGDKEHRDAFYMIVGYVQQLQYQLSKTNEAKL